MKAPWSHIHEFAKVSAQRLATELALTRIRLLVVVGAVVAPQPLKRLIYRFLLGWSIDRTARIGFSFIFVNHLVLEPNCSISHGNVIKGCDLVQLGAGSRIGAFNWISGPPPSNPESTNRERGLVLGRGASITNRHLLDCTDSITLGDFAVLAGNRSQILTHEPSVADGSVRTAPVEIGDHSVVFTSVVLLAGARVPSRCVVAAGAVVLPGLTEELQLYGGVPARSLKRLSEENLQFTRQD